jgi:hypothetical protein
MSATKAPLLPAVQGMNGPSNSAAAINDGKASEVKLSNMRAFAGGRKHRRGGGDSMQSPQFTMAYKPTGANGQDPNALITKGIQGQNQSIENAGGDKFARQVGGKRRRKTRKSKQKTRRRKTKKYRR